MSAFIHALYETNMAGVLRYVWRNNSQPKLTAIVPHIKADCEVERLCARDCKIPYTLLLYSGKLVRENTFVSFAVLWLLVKVFSTKFGGMASIGAAKGSNPQMFCPQKSLIHESFLLRKFPAIRYEGPICVQGQ